MIRRGSRGFIYCIPFSNRHLHALTMTTHNDIREALNVVTETRHESADDISSFTDAYSMLIQLDAYSMNLVNIGGIII